MMTQIKTRRPWLFATLCCLLWLVACSQAPEAKPIVVVSETETSRTIEHTFGQTEIPTNPQRILAIGEDGLLVDLLDLGFKPVASTVNVVDPLPIVVTAVEVEGIDLIATSADISIEALLAYNPDLIIGTVFFIHQLGYDRLKEIAPTVAIGGADPIELYVQTAAVFGLQAEAEADVAEFKTQVQAEGERINSSQIELSVGAVYVGPNLALFVDGPQTAPTMLRELGVTMLPTGEEREALKPRNGRVFISEERIDLLSGDTLILLQTESVEGEMDALAEMNSNPIWGQLPAVQAGNVFTVDRLGYPGFRGQQALLAELVAIFE